jgi:hypothetical protein
MLFLDPLLQKRARQDVRARGPRAGENWLRLYHAGHALTKAYPGGLNGKWWVCRLEALFLLQWALQ